MACGDGYLLSQTQHSFVARKQFAKNRLTRMYDFSGRRIIFLREIPIRLRRSPVRTRIRYRATVHARGEPRSLRTAKVLARSRFLSWGRKLGKVIVWRNSSRIWDFDEIWELMKYCSRWSLRARILDSEATFGALRTISWYMACIDFLLQVILLPPSALLLANVSRLFGRLAHQNQDF